MLNCYLLLLHLRICLIVSKYALHSYTRVQVLVILSYSIVLASVSSTNIFIETRAFTRNVNLRMIVMKLINTRNLECCHYNYTAYSCIFPLVD